MTLTIDKAPDETTERRARPRRSRPGLILAATLFADSILHLYWATGATWPAADTRTLSHALLGMHVRFTPDVVLPLAALMAVAAMVVFARSWLGRQHRLGWVWQVGTMIITAGLTLRALLGVLWAVPGLSGVGSPFTWINLFLLTPLCAALAVLGYVLLSSGTSERRIRRRRSSMIISARSLTATVPVLVVAALLVAAFGYAPTPQRDYQPSTMLGPIASQYVETPVARFHYVQQGSGSPVVLLSPGSAWAASWLPQLKVLSKTHSVYVVDLPGQGFTQLRDPDFVFDLDGMTNAIGSFLDAVDLPRTALAGNSWSGGWALAYAQRQPDRVSSLLLLAPSGLAEADPLGWEILKLPVLGRALTHLSAGSRSTTADGLAGLFVDQDIVTADLINSSWAPNTLPDNVRSMYELEAGLDWSVTQAALPNTRQPTLIIWGRQDSVLPVASARTFAASMPDVRVHLLDLCGHGITLDCPAETSALMRDFLDGQ